MADEDESACNVSGRKRKRGLAAIEPPEFVGDTKTCSNSECRSTEHCVFKYLNNGKPNQPRYRCLRCNHMHTHYPPGKERPRPHGKTYTKHTLANPPEHCDLFDLRCPNPGCGALENQARFLYYNNKKHSQPRYRCLVCNVPWQPKLKSKLPAQPDIEGVPSIDMQEFVPAQETSYYNPEYSANLGPGIPNCLPCTMQAQQQPPYNYPADQFVNVGSCTELYPNGDPNYMDVMQGSQFQQQYYSTTDPVNSMGACTEYANVNYTMQGQQPYSESQDQYVDLGGVDGSVNYTMQGQQPYSESQFDQYVDLGGVDGSVNYTMQGQQPYSESLDQYVDLGGVDGSVNYMLQVQQPCSEVSQEYYVNSLGCTHDPSISYINMLQACDPSGHISVQAGDQEQLCHPKESFASLDTFHMDANTIKAGGEQYDVYPKLDPALSCGISALDAPEDMDQWISELLAVDG